MSDTIGKRITEARKRAGLTQHQLADRIPYSRATIAGVEVDKDAPGIGFITAVADTLNLSVDWLLGRTAPRSGKTQGEIAKTPNEIALLRFWRGLSPSQRKDVMERIETMPLRLATTRRKR